ncbi:MAG TPA: hypothetical protein PKG77_23290 [Phycisphaerae bacterium]|nr:hypothetical protein [Phycisphaerae bacterium]HQL76146.1 hypothetical protein [Phycisphaerae bacterium]
MTAFEDRNELAIQAQQAHEAFCLLQAARDLLRQAARQVPLNPELYDLRNALRGLAAAGQPAEDAIWRYWVRWLNSVTTRAAKSEAQG